MQRVYRDDKRVIELERQVAAFIEELDAIVELLDQRYGPLSIGIDAWRQLRVPAVFRDGSMLGRS